MRTRTCGSTAGRARSPTSSSTSTSRSSPAIVTTHAHADHWGELPVAHVAFEHYVHRRDVPVFGTAETRERLEAARGAKLAPTFDWHTITDGSTFEVGRSATGCLRFTCAETDHPVETLAMRVDDIDGGRTLVYSADTGSDWPLATLGDGHRPRAVRGDAARRGSGYLHALDRDARPDRARPTGRCARGSSITHLAPGLDLDRARRAAAEAFGGPVDMAAPHLTIETMRTTP